MAQPLLPALSSLLLVALGLGSIARADGAPELEVRGLFETEAAFATGEGGLQKWDIVLSPELRLDMGDSGVVTAIGRLRTDPVDELEPGQPDASNGSRAGLTRRAFVGDAGDLELRELYWDRDIGDMFLRLGKQQIVWGEADGLRVLDQINPLSFREFVMPDFEDRRIPLWTAQLEMPLGADSLAQLIWIPDHSYDEIPTGSAAFAPTSPRLVPQRQLVGQQAADRPDRLFRDDDYGLRISSFLDGWDLSANYLYHYQDQAAPVIVTGAGGDILAPRFERTHLLGGSFSNAFGDITLRGEAAYSTNRFFITADPSDTDGVLESGEFSYVLGLDYQTGGDLFLSGQLFQSFLPDHRDGITRAQLDSTITLLAEHEFLNDRLSLGAQVLQSVNDGDGLLQLDLDYDWKSNVVLSLGLDIFYGDRDGLFGQFDGNDRITAGIEIGF